MDLGRALWWRKAPMRMLAIKAANPDSGQVASAILVGYEQQAEYGIYCENAVKLRFTDGEIVGVGRDAVGFCMIKGYALFADNLHFRGYESQSMGMMMRTSELVTT